MHRFIILILPVTAILFICQCENPRETIIYKPIEDTVSLQIIYSDPPAGSTGEEARSAYSKSYDAAVQFNKPMNTLITSGAVMAQRDSSNHEIERIGWQGSEMMLINFREKRYQVGFSYKIIIDETAEALDGDKLTSPDTIEFLPEPELRIVRIYYNDAIMGTGQDELGDSLELGQPINMSLPLMVILNSPMPLEGNDSRIFIKAASDTIFPHPLDSGFIFPLNGLEADNQYRIEMLGDLADTSGNMLNRPHFLSMNTDRFRLISADYEYQGYLQTADSVLFTDTTLLWCDRLVYRWDLVFNHDIKGSMGASVIEVNPPVDSFYLKYTSSLLDNRVRVYVVSPLIPDTTYQIFMTASFVDTFGTAIEESTRIVFRTEKFYLTGGLLFGTYMPGDSRRPDYGPVPNFPSFGFTISQATGVNRIQALDFIGLSNTPVYSTFEEFSNSISFNAELDSSSLESAISMTPRDSNFSFKAEGFNVKIISGAFLTPETDYKFTVNTKLKSIYGDTLDMPLEIEFTSDSFGIYRISAFKDSISFQDTLFVQEALNPNIHFNKTFYFTYALDLGSVSQGFSIVPALDGQIFVDGNKFRVFNTSPMIPETDYRITFDSTIKESHGKNMANTLVYQFTTEPFKINHFTDYHKISQGLYKVRFNSFVDLDTLASHSHFEPSAKYNAFFIGYSDSANLEIVFDTDSIPLLGERIFVEIDSLTTDVNGKVINETFRDTFDILMVKY
jgi:hypothetical protein